MVLASDLVPAGATLVAPALEVRLKALDFGIKNLCMENSCVRLKRFSLHQPKIQIRTAVPYSSSTVIC